MKQKKRLQVGWLLDPAFFLLCFSIPFVLYGRLFVAGELPFDTDGIQYFSSKLFALQAVKNGQLPLWNPYLCAGMPFLEDFSSLLYPPDWLGLFLPFKWFVYSFYGLHLALGGYFFSRYLRELNLGRSVSFTFGLIYAMSIHLAGFRKGHMALIVPTVSFAVIMFLIQKYLNTQKLCWLLGSGTVMAVFFMAGVIQYVFYIDATVFLYLLISGIRRKMPVRRILGHGIVWGASYLGMICVQLLPVLGIMHNYSRAGASQPDYLYFTSYCMHPIKLLMMLFPNIFGSDVLQPYGLYNSSEMDIELFLGVGILALLLFGLWRQRKQFQTRLYAGLALLVLIYCVNAHLPVLPHLLYRIPFVGGFRCPSRALFLFVFFCYVLAARAVASLRDADELRRFSRWLLCFFGLTAFAAAAYAGGVLYSNTDHFAEPGKLGEIAHYLIRAFVPALLALALFYAVCRVVLATQAHSLLSHRGAFALLCTALVVLTLGETQRFSTRYTSVPANVLSTGNAGLSALRDTLGSGKLLMTQDIPDGAFSSPLAGNANMIMGISSVNGYVAFNNPRLYALFSGKGQQPSYNSTGLLTGFPHVAEVLRERNSVLSMLGVRYILDPQGHVPQDGSCVSPVDGGAQPVITDRSLTLMASEQLQAAGNFAFSIEPQTLYLLSFDAETDTAQTLSADLFGGDAYDSAEQENKFQLKAGKSHYEFCYHSGDTAAAGDTTLRFLAAPATDIRLSGIMLQKLECRIQTGVYVYKTSISGMPVYENTNAKELIFVPKRLEKIMDEETFLANIEAYDLTAVSYLSESEARSIDADAAVTDIRQTLNTASAKVTSAGETFVNFSECYFPGWRVYIDGQRGELVVVDGVIQGTYVPAGTHAVEFRYHPTILYASAAVSGISLCTVTVWIAADWRRRRKKGVVVVEAAAKTE